MAGVDTAYVGETAIAYFQIISIEEFVQYVFFRKVFVNNFQELFGDICFHVQTIWWVEPNNIT